MLTATRRWRTPLGRSFGDMRLRPEEPHSDRWRVLSLEALLDLLLPDHDAGSGARRVLAVDGRSSSGKTTLASRLADVAVRSTVVHTDDIAWWHSRFGWSGLLTQGIIEPFRAGEPVAFRPPAWDERGREGSITVPAETSMLIVEGVGSSRQELAAWIDATLWVQADEEPIAERNAARIEAGETTSAGLAGWMSEERPFLAEDRPWERATAIVAGTGELPHKDCAEALVAGPA